MAEYIEREAAISECLKYNYADKYDKWAVKCILKSIPAADVIEVGSCDGCYWKGKGRFQKCTYCRRNRNLKDRYLEEGAFDG